LAEATYRFGFTAICNTRPLAELYKAHGGVAHFFTPAVDPTIFYANQHRTSTNQNAMIFCYARPGHPRNCFEVVSAGLKQLKEQLGSSVHIVTAGADWDVDAYELRNIVEHLGLLGYEDTGELYRACDIGLVAMATRHPSYLPFELMACGALVATNINPYTQWLLKDRENSLQFELTKSSIAETLVEAVTNDELRLKLSQRGAVEIASRYSDWDSACQTVYDILRLQ
jgi:glycosyltransferase involved in cell wall biosynthesis